MRALDLAYLAAIRRLDRAKTSARFAERCERQALTVFRHPSWGEPSYETVLFTVLFTHHVYFGTHSELAGTFIERYQIAGAGGAKLLAAPRWVYETMLVLWPLARRGTKDVPETREEIRAVGLQAGMSTEHVAGNVNIDTLALLWDDDPLQLYFDLDDVLLAVAQL